MQVSQNLTSAEMEDLYAELVHLVRDEEDVKMLLSYLPEEQGASTCSVRTAMCTLYTAAK